MQSYPSPTALAADQGHPFYASNQSLPVSAAEELQLSAQISRNLAPMMHAGPGGPMAEAQGSRPQENINHQFEHEQDPRRGNLQPLQHSPMGPMDHLGPHGQYSPTDGSVAPRKRSKVSRACDECRRKKIRCDATGEVGDEQCSNCRRTSASCQFSRVPMKRGPSKGYIKELAERLNHLEGAISHNDMSAVPNQFIGHPNDPMRRPSDEFSPTPNADGVQRKRTHSSISGDFNSPYQNQRPPSWAQPQQEHARQFSQQSPAYATPQSGPMFREPNYSPNGLAPTPQWRNAPDLQRQSNSFENVVSLEQGQVDQSLELTDTIIDQYYNTIHPTYPILSLSHSRVRARLSNCPLPLKHAFHEALHAAVLTVSSPGHDSAAQQSIQKATQLVSSFQFEHAAARTVSANLILLQTMMLLAVEAETHITNERSGPSRSVWLGSAVGLAYSLKLHLQKRPEDMVETDPDSDDKIGRRIWLSLVIMDRWHASSTSSPILIPDLSVVIYLEDQVLLGEAFYQLARLSVVLGHFAGAALVFNDLTPPTDPAIRLAGTLLRGEMERWRESFPQTSFPPSNLPLVHITYLHLRILMELHHPDSELSGLLAAASNVVAQLTHNSDLISPITYQCTALAALVLIELAGYESTREEAETNLMVLSQNRIAHSAWDQTIRDLINKKQSAAVSNAPLTASQNLQQLAELATATGEGRDSTASKEGDKSATARYKELRGAIRTGYLNYILGVGSGL
ncbi:putative transcriptional regulatory protein [Lachnellula occidentalis]|uniref:Putative transcriptional regulatory protein n=1 Tax=Lachnellula occidentalis TaxID=215460 RepID=A0A8H8RL85_9HELO|nr:putative transcriptional regulatory protein [Lachnellula occidentalis]